ncbi:hypothetical protein NBO_53g0001 [Nosema bombycis CQ1]|uniref:Uncharacterized protein n=1 Tax=Nosema bombycis (strain CQ1 / CVCC 102059) TaxID=578461 RepID=R0KSZ1_NOSB1|nr:hypothetical protein NBO_53g0001 [Nosema bombycis CQ1]|eukprot:EOB13876.1 hypothetical protein NBO_53g0001 [Nosema bombycis CQ1]
MYYKEKITLYADVYLTINNMREKTEKINMAYNYFGSELQKIKVSRNSYDDLDKINKKFIDSKISNHTEEIFKEKERLLISLEEGKKHANLVLSILNKFSTLTPEEFEADEEVKQFLK